MPSARWLLVAAGLVVPVVWFAVRPAYYRHVLEAVHLPVVIYCDTSPFADGPVEVILMYDKVALSPLARALGVHQNRPVAKVRRFHMIRTDRFDVGAYAVRIAAVPRGPLRRIMLADATGRRWYIDVGKPLPNTGIVYLHAGFNR